MVCLLSTWGIQQMAGSSENTQKLFSRIFLGVIVLALSGGIDLFLGTA
jgi:hypothetical protein